MTGMAAYAISKPGGKCATNAAGRFFFNAFWNPQYQNGALKRVYVF
jgi:hypothetical protein